MRTDLVDHLQIGPSTGSRLPGLPAGNVPGRVPQIVGDPSFLTRAGTVKFVDYKFDVGFANILQG